MPGPADLLSGRRILIVEDEYLIASEMAGWLHRAGAERVWAVPGVDAALDLIAAEPRIDVAVLDLDLGEGERVDPVAARLRSLGVPYLIATGEARAVGGLHHDRPRLEKPVPEDEFLRQLAGLVGARPL